MANYSGIQKEYQQFIIDRRDLLVPKNIREIKGSFFTPKVCADKSKEYLASVLGRKWEKDYYIWDCAAGTGNLLAGLTNKYNIWASDIDEGNIETIHSLIDIDDNLDLIPSHVFKFDFLNDSFDILPEELQEIIKDDSKRRKLVIYINPPYAEATSATTVTGTGQNKAGVATTNKMKDRYQKCIGKAHLDASFYDIKEFFQGRSENGSMKTKSNDETYNELIKSLRQDMLVLSKKIQPKVYEYGFLKK